MGTENTGGRPRIIETPEQFDARVDEYVAQCAADEEPITWTGMALHLGFTSREAMDNYLEYDGFLDSVKRAKALVQNAYEKRLSSTAAAGAIFALKNFGWSDRQEIESTNRHVITEEAMQPDEWEGEYTE